MTPARASGQSSTPVSPGKGICQFSPRCEKLSSVQDFSTISTPSSKIARLRASSSLSFTSVVAVEKPASWVCALYTAASGDFVARAPRCWPSTFVQRDW